MRDASPFTDVSDDAVRQLQTQYAEALLREPENAFKAATTVFGADTGRAVYVAAKWIADPFVISEKTRLLQSKGARFFLPSKEEYAREIWRTAIDNRTPAEDKRALLSLYGDVMGYKETPKKDGGIVINNNKVLLVRDHGTDEDWERKAAAQQHRLTHDTAPTDVIARPVH